MVFWWIYVQLGVFFGHELDIVWCQDCCSCFSVDYGVLCCQIGCCSWFSVALGKVEDNGKLLIGVFFGHELDIVWCQDC